MGCGDPDVEKTIEGDGNMRLIMKKNKRIETHTDIPGTITSWVHELETAGGESKVQLKTSEKFGNPGDEIEIKVTKKQEEL